MWKCFGVVLIKIAFLLIRWGRCRASILNSPSALDLWWILKILGLSKLNPLDHVLFLKHDVKIHRAILKLHPLWEIPQSFIKNHDLSFASWHFREVRSGLMIWNNNKPQIWIFRNYLEQRIFYFVNRSEIEENAVTLGKKKLRSKSNFVWVIFDPNIFPKVTAFLSISDPLTK